MFPPWEQQVCQNRRGGTLVLVDPVLTMEKTQGTLLVLTALEDHIVVKPIRNILFSFSPVTHISLLLDDLLL